MKRKTLLLMLLMALFAPWTAKAQETIWSETFENYSGSGETALSSDWTTPAMYGTKPCVHLGDQWAAANGSNSLECRTNTSTTIMFVLPQFNKNLNTLTVKFNAAGHASGRGQLGYVTNANNSSTFTSLTDISQPVTLANGSYTEYSYDLSTLNAPASSSYRLAVKYTFVGSGEDSWYFDDFNVTYTEPSGGDSGDSDCENFDSTNGTSSYSTGGILPSGWHRIYGGTTETGGTVYDASATSPANMPHVVTTNAGTPGAPNSSNYICFYSENGTYSYAIMPPVESGAVSHLSFKYKFESASNGTLTYGAISGTDASTYTVLGTISNPSSNPGTIDVDLNTSQTKGKRIAFRWYKSGTWYTCGIDDVCIETTTIIPYEISTVADWNDFCAAVNSGHSYSGETVTLMNDITTAVTAMAGTSTDVQVGANAFKGTFDGQGHTLTIGLTKGTSTHTAPFVYINGATIKNLNVEGENNIGNNQFAAGLVGIAEGTNTITNCKVNVTINSTKSGDGTHGGFISLVQGGTTTFNGCAFTGKLLGANTNSWGGYVGYSRGTSTLNNCVFVPQELSFSNSGCSTFVRNGSNFNNCYYTQTCGSTQGKLMHSITWASGITVANAGTATSYTPETSTIVGYGTGIKFNNILYAGSGENVSLTLSGGNNYMVDHGTLTSSGSSYTLQMADYDTYIFVPNTVSVSANPNNGGTVSGGGQFANGASATVSAIPTGTYCFVSWTENSTVVSTDLNYTFTVTEDRNLVANFVSFDTNITVSGNTTIACGSTTTLTASGLNGVAYNWYSDEACTQLVQENSATLTTPALIENTTYYVKAVGGTSLVEGTPTTYTSSGSYTYSVPSGTPAVKLEVWGAQGGSYNATYSGGKGGYSVGTFSATPGSALYVVVGGQPTAYTTTPTTGGADISGGYNGGGSSKVHYYSSNWSLPQGGGGATHIATVAGVLSDLTSNQDKVLVVAGGGSGSVYYYTGSYGGFTGYAGGGSTSIGYTGGTYTYTANQTDPGYGGSFGQGASYTNRTNYKYGPSGGGGGWYGGGNRRYADDTYSEELVRGHGGGSGYVKSTLADAQTIAGNAPMPNPEDPNGGTMTGREGDGYARITAYVTEECESAAVAVTVTVTPFTKPISPYGNSERGGYYLIASPLAADVDPATVTGMITDNYGSSTTTTSDGTYDLYSFNQAETDEWQNYRASNFYLVNGTGYLYASKYGTTLTFSGAPYSGDTKTVTLSMTAAATGRDFPAWNLVGNPFALDNAYIDKSFYTLENSDTYTLNTVGTAIHPMQGLFVVADEDGETLTFSKTPNREVASLNMNVSKVATRGVSAGTTNVIDQAIISFTEGQELPKLQFRNGSTKVYLPKDGKEYAIVSAESMGTMPVNFKAEDNGTYTLDFTTKEVSFGYLHLIDNMNGNDVDLLQTPYYTFDAKSTDFASRFTVVFATGSSTGSETDNFAFFNNGVWIINNPSTGSGAEATLQVVDVLGRVLSSETISGSCSKAINVATGVYMLRLINGNNVKVQKVVVKR